MPVRLALNATESPDSEKFYILNMVGDVPSIGATADAIARPSQVRRFIDRLIQTSIQEVGIVL